jgi:hypothetical protein
MPPHTTAKGLRLFLDAEQQRAWLDGEASPTDGERADCDAIEQRFKYSARFDKLLQRPQAQEVLEILRIYAERCIPVPRTTERFYWSVSCLPSTDKTFARVNSSWMELFALQPDGDDVRARIILHLSDFTSDGSSEPDQLDRALLEACAQRADHAIWRNGKGILIAEVRSAASIRAFLAHPVGLRAIRRFNLTHMNRGRNAYQASHCYSLADAMLE